SGTRKAMPSTCPPTRAIRSTSTWSTGSPEVTSRPLQRWLLAIVLLGLTACGPATTGSSSPASGALPAAPARSEPAASPTAAAANGADLTILGIIGPKFPFLFMVPATIQGADDLRGKNVGVSTIGDSSDIATRLALPRLGLDPNADVTIVATGSSQNRRTA